jgi:hypothetical protein
MTSAATQMLSWNSNQRKLLRMKIITIHRLSLHFDAGQITHGDDLQQANLAVDLINTLLRRQPFGLNAQLIATPDEIEVESSGDDESE